MRVRPEGLLLPVLLAVTSPAAAQDFDIVLSAQFEYLDAYLIKGDPPFKRRVFVDPDNPKRGGRHLNGRLCFFPDNAPSQFRKAFVIADDTYREACVETDAPQARCNPSHPNYVGNDPDGWGVFNSQAQWTKKVIAVREGWSCDEEANTCVQPQGTIDPQGCAFDTEANLYGNDVGGGEFGVATGSLIVFFAVSQDAENPPYTEHCFLANDLASAGMPLLVEDDPFSGGRAIYVPEPGAGEIAKFVGDFPASRADCMQLENGQWVPEVPLTRESFVVGGEATPISMAIAPTRLPTGLRRFYIGSVLVPPVINEYDEAGVLLRNIVPPFVPKNPLGTGLDRNGILYYAELNLSPPPNFETGCGSVSMVRFDALGNPQAPVQLSQNLRFPDGITVIRSSDFQNIDFEKLPPAPELSEEGCTPE